MNREIKYALVNIVLLTLFIIGCVLLAISTTWYAPIGVWIMHQSVGLMGDARQVKSELDAEDGK